MKSPDLDFRTQSQIWKISLSRRRLQDFLISSFNETLPYEFFKRCKAADLCERAVRPLLIIPVYLHENPTFSKSPRISVNQMIMFKLKNTSPKSEREEGRAVELFGVILTLSHFHYLFTVTVRDGNKGGTNSMKQQGEERGGLKEERICGMGFLFLIICQILICNKVFRCGWAPLCRDGWTCSQE